MKANRIGSIASVAQTGAHAHNLMTRLDLVLASHFVCLEIAAQHVHWHHLVVRHTVGHVEHLERVEISARVSKDDPTRNSGSV